MKVLHVIDRYYPSISGSELYLREIGERLAREGHAVSVYTTTALDLESFWSSASRVTAEGESEHNGVRIKRFPIERLPAAPLAYPLLRRTMARVALLPFPTAPLLLALSRWTPRVPALEHALARFDESIDLIHAVNIPLDSIINAAARLARRRRLPFVVTPFIHLGEPDDPRVRRFYTMPHQLEMLRSADAVLVQTGLELEALALRGVSRDRMHCIGAGVNPDDLSGGDAQRFRTKYHIQAPIIFFIGTAAYDKGAMHLVEAMEQVWRKGDSVNAPTLVIAGPLLEPFQRFMRRRPAETRQRTRVLGFISDEDKRDLLAAGDILVLPSRTDSFGIVYLEAWLYNKPVIGARAGGIPDVISGGRDGFLVKFGDTAALAARIDQLLADHDLAQRLGSAGHAKVLGGMTWDKVYHQVRSLYGQLTRLN